MLRLLTRPKIKYNTNGGHRLSQLQYQFWGSSTKTLAQRQKVGISRYGRFSTLIRLSSQMDDPSFRTVTEAVSLIGKRPPAPRHVYPGFPQSFWQRKKPDIVVGGVMALCSAVYVGNWWADQRARNLHDVKPLKFLHKNFVCSLENVREGRWWVMLTSSITHFDLIHFGLNMVGVWSFGRLILYNFGTVAFLGAWTLGGFACAVSSLLYNQRRLEYAKTNTGRRLGTKGQKEQQRRIWFAPKYDLDVEPLYGGSVGASGSILSLAAVAACLAPRLRIGLIPFPFLTLQLWVWLAGETALSLYCMDTGLFPSISHAGHLGGTAAGIASYYAVLRPWLRRAGRM